MADEPTTMRCETEKGTTHELGKPGKWLSERAVLLKYLDNLR
jgi:hypothetical protein